MRISTRSRYGLRLMINLAASYNNGYAFLKDTARREDISEKYLSQIVIPLKRAGLLSASRGVHGGYSLGRPPQDITVKEIIEVLEGDLLLIDCGRDPESCNRFPGCASRSLWEGLAKNISDYLSSVSLGDLLKIKQDKESKSIDYSI